MIKNYKNILVYIGILAGIYFLYIHNLGSYELMDVDETRYVDMSKTMFENKDFLTLYLNGDFFFEKPPLYFWILNISFLIFRKISAFTARIPCVLSGIIAGLGVFFTSFKITNNKKFSFIASSILLTSMEFLVLSKIAILDIVLASCTTLSILFGIVTFYVADKNKKYFWWLFYLFSGLAVMAKGIPGFVLPFASMFFIGLYTKKFKEYFKPQYFIVGLLIFLATLVPWHLAMFKIHNPLFYEEYIVKHHIMRFLGGEIIHRDEPFWFYIPVFLVGFVPFSFGFIALLIEKLKNIKYRPFNTLSLFEGYIALCVICALTVFLFFSSSKTKLVTYIAPIFPFVSLIIAKWWYEYIENNEHKKYVEISSIIFNVFLILGGIIAPFVFTCLENPANELLLYASYPASIILIAFATAGLVFIKKQKKSMLLGSYVVMMIFLSAFCFHKFLTADYGFGEYDLINYARYAKENDLNIFTYETKQKYSLLYYSDKHAYFNIKLDKVDDVLNNPKNILIVRNDDLDELYEYEYNVLAQGEKFSMLSKK